MGNTSGKSLTGGKKKGPSADELRKQKYDAYVKSTLAPDYAAAQGGTADAIKKYDADRDYVLKNFDPTLDPKKYPYINPPGDTFSIMDLSAPFTEMQLLPPPSDDDKNDTTVPSVPTWVLIGGAGVLTIGVAILVLK